jgi:mannose-1-phosphate guanylyltransferase
MTLYAVLLAGGSGTRLWPLSITTMPKQFLSLQGERSMLQATADRLRPLILPHNTYVVTFAEYVSLVREQLTGLSNENMIVQPSDFGTAAAVGLAATFIAAREPKAIMGSFPADLLFSDREQFRKALQVAETLADQGYLVALGVEPTSAETGYGYIRVGETLNCNGYELAAFKAPQYINKPDRKLAEEYIHSGEYLWHTGVFIWRVDRILDEIRQHMAGLYEVLDAVRKNIFKGYETISTSWTELRESVSIEFVVEKSNNIVVIPLHMAWSDLGSWGQIASLYPTDKYQNRAYIPSPGFHIAIDTHETFVYSVTGRIIATVGIEDLIIVDTGEALLICQKDHAQQVKKVSEILLKESQSL